MFLTAKTALVILQRGQGNPKAILIPFFFFLQNIASFCMSLSVSELVTWIFNLNEGNKTLCLVFEIITSTYLDISI